MIGVLLWFMSWTASVETCWRTRLVNVENSTCGKHGWRTQLVNEENSTCGKHSWRTRLVSVENSTCGKHGWRILLVYVVCNANESMTAYTFVHETSNACENIVFVVIWCWLILFFFIISPNTSVLFTKPHLDTPDAALWISLSKFWASKGIIKHSKVHKFFYSREIFLFFL